MEPDIIEFEHASHRYGPDGYGITDITMRIPKGAFVVLAGPNGSGKTTLLKHLNGLLLPNSGDIRINGLSLKKHLKTIRQLVGMVFQNADHQIVGQTVYDDTAFGPENLRLNRAEIDRRVEKALRQTGLTGRESHDPDRLSGGEKKRLAIAGVLAMQPEILVFDEPFAGLDYPGVCEVLQAVLDLHRTGHTIIVATHDLEKIIAHADRLIILSRGKIVLDGAPEDIIGETEHYGVRPPCSTRYGLGLIPWNQPLN